uniref:Structural maintenance of chromosomes protein n=1 Tax=Panagrolaimus sp. JU765 TaxID=591449 RepID=A0AC34Q9T0_9BILA
MRLKKLEIDGFKSYAKPVVITDFDPSFNAITGYNGTGKSNVLDALCFVLGISMLKQVRATRWTDLIYKQAQAGIQKASVTATFEHNDPKHKIQGFDLGKDIIVRRQVVSNGRVTYTVNGSNATQQRVQEMFRSIGMNVNNPHFLIMQGKIGKVLNMNAKEILAMVEEAVGVRIYECKKVSCLRTIEKKEEKMAEISKILDEDILPKVTKLNNERESFLKFERLKCEVAKLKKRVTAYEYISTERGIQMYKDEANAKRANITEIEEEIENAKARMKELDAEISGMTKNKDGKMDKERGVIQTKLNDLEKIQMEKESAVGDVKTEITTAKQALTSLEKSKATSKKEITNKQKKMEEIDKENGEKVRLMNKAEEDLKLAQNQRTALQRNMVLDEEGNEANPNEMVIRYNGQITQLTTEITRCKEDIKNLENRIREKQQEIQRHGNHDVSNLSKRKDEFTKRLTDVRKRIEKLNFDEKLELDLQKQMQEAQVAVNQVSGNSSNFERRYGGLLMTSYNPFPPDFPKEQIYGPLFTLFSVKDPKFYKAIDVIFGYAFPNIIVEKAQCATTLLRLNLVTRRRTFIPLDDIRGEWCSDGDFKRAKALCKGEIYHPRELLRYDQKFDLPLRHFIKNALICSDRDDASRVTADLNIRTVTLLGDEFRPGGMASGGISRGRETIMEDIAAYNQSMTAVNERKTRLEQLREEQRKVQESAAKYRELKGEEEHVLDSLKQIDEQLKHDLVNTLKEDLKSFEERKVQMKDKIKENESKLPEIEKKKEEFEKQRNQKDYFEKEIEKVEKMEKDAKERLKKYNTAQQQKQQLDKIKDEIARLEEDIVQTDEEIEAKRQQLVDLDERLRTAQAIVEEAKATVETQRQVLAEHDSKMNEQENLIKEKQAEKSAINKQILEMRSNKETVEKAVDADEQKSKDCKTKVADMLKKNPWIAADKKHFNVAKTDYDFTDFNYEENKRKLQDKNEELTEISENINPDAGQILDQNEEQVTDLQKKREQLRQDKQKLLETIKNLDERKKTEMKTAFKAVNETFGAIFQTLLNDAQAQLVATSGNEDNLDEGLEFRVGFNNMWKDSLSELSGGQRSLVALSLILSLLRFKPAPLYILDEVDAALDISHTSNIGVLIKQQFKEAQFLIVSLKPGLFKNANAIFRTQMQDGVSAVLRVQDDYLEDMETVG